MVRNTLVVLDKYHWMLYFLVPAMSPRFMITLGEDLNPLPVTVRVGQVGHESYRNV
jgi:26S proteasome regulatory subunit N1